MSLTRTFDLSTEGWLSNIADRYIIGWKVRWSGVKVSFRENNNAICITLTGNVDALDELFWTLRDEFGERIREVK